MKPPSGEYRPVEELIPYARNARTHTAEQVDQIAASIVEFGWTNPVLADSKGIACGHGRVLAARKIYKGGGTIRHVDGTEMPKGTVPTLSCEGWSEAQRRAYIIADNKIALNAGWDEALLRVEIEALQEMNFDLSLTGFSIEETTNLMAPDRNAGLTDPDEEQGEPPVNPISALGDVWICGNHRIMCGDSTSATDVSKLLGTVKPHIMVTDPPYGVEYDAGWRNKAKRTKDTTKTVGGTAMGKVLNDDRADWHEAWELFPGDVAYVWHAGLHTSEVYDSLTRTGFKIRAQIIWVKSSLLISRGHYHWQHEPCWYAVRDKATGHWHGDRKQSTIWKIDKPQKSETGHSTQKPVECMLRPIENNSSPGQAIYEPFSGSGTTIVACEMTGRCCFAMELNPGYVDVAVSRWQSFSGNRAMRESDGALFSDLAPSVKLAIKEPKDNPKPKKKAKDK